jgi:hypothetical protein
VEIGTGEDAFHAGDGAVILTGSVRPRRRGARREASGAVLSRLETHGKASVVYFPYVADRADRCRSVRRLRRGVGMGAER